ncbi:MAG: enoyl-CoA hydratase/isomerase family protein [Nocardioidaceae bacterium]
MNDQPVTLEYDDGVAVITLNRPDAMNSLTTDTKVALRDTVLRVAEDEKVRCVVLTGTGRAFCVGQDLKEHAAVLSTGDTDGLFSTVGEHYNPMVTALATMPKPVLAAVNGIAAGAGASLAFACDFRLLADSAGFNLAFSGIGLSCDTGSSWTLPRLVGRAKALELLYFPRTLNAQESLDLGLATEVVPATELTARATELAGRLASGPTLAFGAIRRSLTFAAGEELAAALAYEAEMMALTGATSDHHRAVDSFLAKQKPSFEGS